MPPTRTTRKTAPTIVEVPELNAVTKFEDSLAALIRQHTNSGVDASFLAAVKIRRDLGTMGFAISVPAPRDETEPE